ncbi:hypothetical protein BYT27DRAFT_7222686 [Phlegmacium glaucopus]|nr:hypothetical protein BYT27DRAFT_7222686 [Phlegmacium glaucopus]
MASHQISTRAAFKAVTSKADKVLFKARNFSYPKQILYLVASFIALISLCHFLSMLHRFITRNKVYLWNRRTTVSLPRLPAVIVDSFRTIAFRWTVPVGSSHELNFAEVGLTLGYMAVIFSWTFVNTTTIAGNKVDTHYYSNRAGLIAASQLPIMVALGMRNNIISCDSTLDNPWLQYGILAGSALTLLCLLTIRPIRERNYEAFLLVHFIFAFIFILGVYLHLRGRNLTYHGAWPSMIIWGLDRFIRLIRLAIINFRYFNPWSSQNSKKELGAVVEVLSPHLLRVTLHRSKHFNWRPGHSAYLSFPSISAFPFESHPFTISTIDDDSTSGENVLVFLIGVHNGFTKKLLQEARTSSDQTYKVFLNGPYGSPPLLMGYQTVILIAGGSGVAFTLPFFLDIRARAGKHSCQKIVFIWAIRDSDHIHWIENTLAPVLENVPPSISVSVQLYITATTTTTTTTTTDKLQEMDYDSKENGFEMVTQATDNSTPRSYSTILQSPFVEVHQGRPDVKSLISQEVDEATGKISINVCGSHSLADAVRKAIKAPRPMDVLRGGPTITLHVEAFGGLVRSKFTNIRLVR